MDRDKSWMDMLRADKQFSEQDIVAGVCDGYARGKYGDDHDEDMPEQVILNWPHEAFQIAMTTPFDCGFGGTNGPRFTVWTKTRVFFPVCYDGAEWVESVSRDPTFFEVTDHVGGG